MSAGDLAAVLVSVVVFAAFVVLVVAVLGVLRSVRELRGALESFEAETVPLLEELRGTVQEAGAEVERVDHLLGAAESISATVEGASRLSYLAFRAPLIRVVAFCRGVGRFVARLGGRGYRQRRRQAAERARADRGRGDGASGDRRAA